LAALCALTVCVSAYALHGCAPKRDAEPSRTLLFGRGADSIGLDAAHEEDGESFKVAELIFDTLVQYQQASTDIEPGLATSWESSPDGLTWTFHLRRNVRFHDGTPCDAEAVVFSIKRQYQPSHPFHNVGGPYLYWLSLGLSDIVDGVRAVDPLTVELRLKRPYAPLLSALATPPFAVVSPAAVRKWGEDFKSNPVGSGPFRFVEWRRNDRIVLERFDGYWAGKSPLDRIVFRSIPDNATRLLELEQGNIHVLEYPDPENIAAIRANPDVTLVEQPGMTVAYLAMNTTHPPLDDVRVRRAINHAINKRLIVETLYGGLAVVAKNPFPPTIWGYNDAIQDYAYDPGRARALLKEAFPRGFPRELSLYALPAPRPYALNPQQVASAIQADLAKVGVPTRVQTFEWGTYLEKVKAGDHDLGMLGWIADYADPDNFLYFNLDKDNARPPAGNIAFYRSDPLHEVLVAAQKELDHDKRVALYKRAQEIIHDDAPWVVLAHAQNVVAIRRAVQDFVLHPTSWRHLWRVRLASR
jgi:peptide/nickel transport system substrate-binding protein